MKNFLLRGFGSGLVQGRGRKGAWAISAALLCAAVMSGRAAKSDGESPTGTSVVYGNIPADQVEFLTSKERILGVAQNGTPTAIWEALEHGERVECMDCIPAVAPLLYDASPVTREIAAWWLRRRVFGVFGPGEVYEQTVNTLKNDPSPSKRAYAAAALGEFLSTPGIAAVSDAIANDKDATVRASAALALGRLNDEGKGALNRALADGDKTVKLAALRASGRINALNADVQPLVALTGDGDAVVRKRAAEVLGARRVKEGAPALIGIAQNDPDASVRGAAAHALGLLGDASARTALEGLSTNDPDRFVRDLASMALRRL